ncbi:MAG: metal-dependent hydrolase [Leptospiraceae bacterium]|nr:metal-dependent hydrolase [Leptospiraceae bacterium]MCP5496348.1 metal-dependent hydrolase [Leptospiraceae bacterium]
MDNQKQFKLLQGQNRQLNQDILVRSFNWDFSNVPRYYLGNNVLRTSMFNGLSSIFPDGEKFFIRSVKYFANEIKDTKLQEEIKLFIAQEVQHGKAHEKFNHFLEEQGYEIEGFVGLFKKISFDILEKLIVEIFGHKMTLSITSAMEHYTAVWANNSFTSTITEDFSPTMKELVYWHSLEEIEHKHVSFDVLKEVDDDYLLRISGMLMGTFALYGLLVVGTTSFLLQEKNYSFFSFLKDMGKVISNRNSIIRVGIRGFLSYFKPDFHPSDIDDRGIAKDRTSLLFRAV